MRKIVVVSALSVVIVGTGLVACGTAKAPSESTSADVVRDLSLAGASRMPRTGFVSAIEQNSNGAPSGNQAGKRIGVPTKKRAPSPAHSPTVDDVASAPPTVHEMEATIVVATAVPAPTTALAPATVPQAPVMMWTDPIRSAPAGSGGPSAGVDAGQGDGERARGEHGRGDGPPGGGVIIRGGGAGRDNCDPPGDRRGGGGILGGTFGGGGTSRIPTGVMPGGSGGRSPRR